MTGVTRPRKPRQYPSGDERRMNVPSAVFNLHVNNAGRRADEEFIATFGLKRWQRHIEPYHEQGIMSLFNRKPNQWQLIWAALVSAFVNEDRRSVYGESPQDTQVTMEREERER